MSSADRIQLLCPGCQAKLKAKPEHAGRQFRCPQCKAEVTVPLRETAGTGVSVAASVAEAPQRDREASLPPEKSAAADNVPRIWKAGDLIAGLYEVQKFRDDAPNDERVYRQGGQGQVYRVYYRDWDKFLALKVPLPHRFQSEPDKQRFVGECEKWVDLGLHPHIVSCHFVHILDRMPLAFAEFVDGGTLKEWITQGKLLCSPGRGTGVATTSPAEGQNLPSPANGRGAGGEGGSPVELSLALDIAIQIAWGMAFAHSKGMIHRDLKPDNVMLTGGGTAKVTDFGLATDTAAMGGTTPGTPAYMPPEQWDRHGAITWATDVYAFGVILFELFCGRKPFELAGKYARSNNEDLKIARFREMQMGESPPDPREFCSSLPMDLAGLMLSCLAKKAADRPANFSEVVPRLLTVYRDIAGGDYPREEPKASDLLADSLNNRGLTYLALGQFDELEGKPEEAKRRSEQAEQHFKDALASDAHHLESVYNWGLLRWRTGRMDDTALTRDLRESATSSEPWRAAVLAAQVELESDDCQAAIELLSPLEGEDARRAEVQRLLTRARELLPTSRCCLRTFEGHLQYVESVFLSADGRYALSGSRDKTLKLWEVASGQCLRTFEGHTDSVTSVFLSADGCYALSGSTDHTLRLWEVSSGHCLRTFEGHTNAVTSVFLSADGRYALSGSTDHTLRLWEVSSGHCLRTFEGHTNAVTSVFLSADGRYALSGSWDQTLRLWEVSSGHCLRTFEGHTFVVYSVFLRTYPKTLARFKAM